MFFHHDQLGMGLELHETAEEARQAAEDALELAIDNEAEESEILEICWGEVMGNVEFDGERYNLSTSLCPLIGCKCERHDDQEGDLMCDGCHHIEPATT